MSNSYLCTGCDQHLVTEYNIPEEDMKFSYSTSHGGGEDSVYAGTWEEYCPNCNTLLGIEVEVLHHYESREVLQTILTNLKEVIVTPVHPEGEVLEAENDLL